jgi:hypothetical protein
VTDPTAVIETVRRIHVKPDAGVLRAVGLNHSFESAVADIVDNSIDAGGSEVLIRFITSGGLARRLLILDNGAGMNEGQIDGAMSLGRPKSNPLAKLGHFGMGLKSASFSQASTLTVLARRQGCAPEGRRMHRETSNSDFEVDVLDADAVGSYLDQMRDLLGSKKGTAVLWDDLRTFPASRDPAVTGAFIENKVAGLRNQLGLLFHRLLKRGTVNISVDVFDTDLQESGLNFTVEPIDPFGYKRTGQAGYPKKFIVAHDSGPLELDCHVWPGGSDSPLFRLHDKPVEYYQGFYLYRNDRLLMTGGWGGVVHENKTLKLARVAIDIENHLDVFTMSMEKTGVRLVPDLVHAIESSAAKDGTTFRDYLDDASDAFKASNRRVRRRTPILPPGQGLHPRVKRTIARESPILEGEAPIRIRWTRMPGDDFVEIDRQTRTLWLNQRYRTVVLHGDSAGVNDAPLLKTLLFLVYEDMFRGQAMGAKDKENQHFWSEVLTTAAQTEEWENNV